MHIRIIFLFAVSLLNSCLLHSNATLSHFSKYSSNALSNIALPVITVVYTLNGGNDDVIEDTVATAGYVLFGSLTAYKMISSIKKAQYRERYYLLKKTLNAGADMILILGSITALCRKSEKNAVLSGACLIGYIAKYLVFNRPTQAKLSHHTQL